MLRNAAASRLLAVAAALITSGAVIATGALPTTAAQAAPGARATGAMLVADAPAASDALTGSNSAPLSSVGASTGSGVVPVASAHAAPLNVLTVCADPNNLPFSNRARQGFENKIVEMLARDMGKSVQYVWWAQRRGYARNTLGRERCEVWPGVASGIDRVKTTRPYYRSTYVFVTRAEARIDDLSLDDARLRSLLVGVQMIGNEAMNTPPAHALARRGITLNVRGYMLYGDYARPNPPAAIMDAVAHGDIDVGLVWGPLAGFFASRSAIPLRVQPVLPASDGPQWPMQYAIAMGVRSDEPQLLAQLNRLLERQQPTIDALLDAYRVPRSAPLSASSGAPSS